LNLSALNEALKTIAELINNMASVALKLMAIGAIIVFEQWVQNY